MLWKIVDILDYLRYYRRGKIKYRVFDFGNTYNAFASNGYTAVWNCYGSTEAAAKEMALFRLNQVMKEEEELGVEIHRDGYTFYRKK